MRGLHFKRLLPAKGQVPRPSFQSKERPLCVLSKLVRLHDIRNRVAGAYRRLTADIPIHKKDLDRCIYQFDMVYRSYFIEFLRFGKITELVVCDNLFEPLRGSVYVVFEDPKAGEKCRRQMMQRSYDGKQLSPAIIRQESLDALICPDFQKQTCTSRHRLIVQIAGVPSSTSSSCQTSSANCCQSIPGSSEKSRRSSASRTISRLIIILN